jgi:ribosomal-protein-serine acetyltransferase
MGKKPLTRTFELDEAVKMRPLVLKDATEIYNTVADSYDHLRTYLHWVTPEFSKMTTKEFVRRNQANAKALSGGSWGIFFNGELAGIVGFVRIDWPSKNAEIGYWISKRFEGRGLITRAVQTLITHAFVELGLNRIEIHCAKMNHRSRAVPERLGFKKEATLRQSQWRHIRFHDMVIYGLLADDARVW